MARQWMQSQVIPGYIFTDEAANNGQPIDAVVIFHGYEEYSILLQGIREKTGDISRLKLISPAGGFEFATCD